MSPIRDHKRDFRRASDFSTLELEKIFDMASEMKAALKQGRQSTALAGKSVALVFEKPSLRTRATFDLGTVQLGGHPIYFAPAEIGLGTRESVPDVAHNLERWFDLIVARTFLQTTVESLADHARIPVVNALSDEEHPCQAMADYLTLREKLGELKGRRLAYLGDGNNICHSLIVIGAKLGLRISVASPEGYAPSEAVIEGIQDDLAASGGSYAFTHDAAEAVAGADAIYTDVWASMGQEEEADSRKPLFIPYQVNRDLVARAPEGALIMHDLPAHRGEEITDEVLDGPNSIVFDQAENRLHAQKAIMAFLDAESA